MTLIKKKKQNNTSINRTKETELKAVSGNKVEIWHTQDVKLSQNYQSASASYGVKLIVADDEEAIKAGIKRAELIVEEPLVEKVNQQRELLKGLSNND
jgi:hypothetical protein